MARINIPDALRRLVTERAKERCEYCLIHQDDAPFTHHIDHIVPLKHSGQTAGDNLALACIECNRYKGADLSAIDPATGSIVSLFSPRSQVWGEHFALEEAHIAGKTPTGRATVILLRLNGRARIIQRQTLIDVGRYPPP